MKNLIFSLMILLVCVPLSIAGANEAIKAPEAVEKDLQMVKGPEQNKALTKDITAWAKKEPLVALAWVSRESPKEFSNFLGTQVIVALSHFNGKIAADWLIKNFEAPDYWRLHNLIFAWSLYGNEIQAADWCMKAPAEARYLSFLSVGDGWCDKDASAAADWALKLKSETDRLGAIHGVTFKWARKDFPKVTAWIKELKPAEAKCAARAILTDWKFWKLSDGGIKYNDAAAIKEWIDKLPFSDKEKEELLKSPPLDMHGRNVK